MRRFLTALTWLCAGIAVLVWVFIFSPIKYNLTPSVPTGFWYVHSIDRPLRRGDIVYFCPPDTREFREAKARGYVPEGDCPGNYLHMMKPIAALPGDTVEVKLDGVRVNGRLITNSKPIATDPKGRALKPRLGRFKVKLGEVWLVSHYHPKSYDSRYFGAIRLQPLQRLAKPIICLHEVKL
jgi:conjugative transfer signal peptidase TraF